MTTTTLMSESILGSASYLFTQKTSENGGILDVPSKGLLELYPAGYTHYSERDNRNRQQAHEFIYKKAVELGTENQEWPFDKKTHAIVIEHDPNNKFDSNALHLVVKTTPDSPLAEIDGLELGFIPRKINSVILKNLNMVNGIRIFKVQANYHKKYYSTKLILGYRETTFTPLNVTTLSRFAAIVND